MKRERTESSTQRLKAGAFRQQECHMQVAAIFPPLLFLVACVCCLCTVTERRTGREFLALTPLELATSSNSSTSRPWPSHEFLQGVINGVIGQGDTPKSNASSPSQTKSVTPAPSKDVGTQRSEGGSKLSEKGDNGLLFPQNKNRSFIITKSTSKRSQAKVTTIKTSASINLSGQKPGRDYLHRSENKGVRTESRPSVPLIIIRRNGDNTQTITKKKVIVTSPGSSPPLEVLSGSGVPFQVVLPKKSELTDAFYSKLNKAEKPSRSGVQESSKPKPDYVDDDDLAWWLEQDPEPLETFPTKAPGHFTKGTWPYTEVKSTTMAPTHITWRPSFLHPKPTPDWVFSTTPSPAETSFPILTASTIPKLTTPRPSLGTKHPVPDPAGMIEIKVAQVPSDFSAAPKINQTIGIRPPVHISTDVTTISSGDEVTTFTQVQLASSDLPANETSSLLQKIPTNIWYRPVINHNYGIAQNEATNGDLNSPASLAPSASLAQPVKSVQLTRPAQLIQSVQHSHQPTHTAAAQSQAFLPAQSLKVVQSIPSVHPGQPNRVVETEQYISGHQVSSDLAPTDQVLLFKLWKYSNRSLELKVQKRLPDWLIKMYNIDDDLILNLNDLPIKVQKFVLDKFSQARQEKAKLDGTWMELPTYHQDSSGATKYGTTGSYSKATLNLHYILWTSRNGYSASKQALQDYVKILLLEQGLPQGAYRMPSGIHQQALSVDDPETWNLLTLPLVLAALNRTKEFYPVPPTIPYARLTTTIAPQTIQNLASLLSSNYHAVSQSLGGGLPGLSGAVVQQNPAVVQHTVYSPPTQPPLHKRVTHFSTTDTTFSFGQGQTSVPPPLPPFPPITPPITPPVTPPITPPVVVPPPPTTPIFSLLPPLQYYFQKPFFWSKGPSHPPPYPPPHPPPHPPPPPPPPPPRPPSKHIHHHHHGWDDDDDDWGGGWGRPYKSLLNEEDTDQGETATAQYDALTGPDDILTAQDDTLKVQENAPAKTLIPDLSLSSTELLKKKGKGYKKKKGGWGGGWDGWGGWGGWDGGGGGWGGWEEVVDGSHASKLAKKYAPYLILFLASVGPAFLTGWGGKKKKGGHDKPGPHYHTHVYGGPPPPKPTKGWGWSGRHNEPPKGLQVKGDIQVYHHIMNSPTVHYYSKSSGKGSSGKGGWDSGWSAPSSSNQYTYQSPQSGGGVGSSGWMQSGSDNIPAVAYGTAVDYFQANNARQDMPLTHSIPFDTYLQSDPTAGEAGGGGGGRGLEDGWAWKDEEAYMEHLKTIGRDIGKAIGSEVAKETKEKKKSKGRFKSLLEGKKNMISEMLGWWIADDRAGILGDGATEFIVAELASQARRKRSWYTDSW